MQTSENTPIKWDDKEKIDITLEAFDKLLRTRRSVRCFTDEPIDDSLIEKIIEYGILAPSNCNMQGVRFIAVKDPAIRAEIIHDRFKAGMGVCTIATVADLRLYDDANIDGAVHDSGAAIENILLACHYFGIGACYIADSGVETPKKCEALKVAPYEKVTALIWVGRYEKAPIIPKRRNLAEALTWI